MSERGDEPVTTSAPCERLEREGLAVLDGDSPVEGDGGGGFEAHLAGCARCQEQLARYRRLTGALREVSGAAKRRPDHVARVLARAPQVPSPPRHNKMTAMPILALVAGVALLWWLRRDPDPPARFAMEIVEERGAVMRGDAQLGATLRVTLQPGAALWIYRNDRELLLTCPKDCRRDGGKLVGELALDAVGSYQVVWLSTDQLPAPGGALTGDLKAAAAAGARHELRSLEVY